VEEEMRRVGVVSEAIEEVETVAMTTARAEKQVTKQANKPLMLAMSHFWRH
jgi:hypothetical protein